MLDEYGWTDPLERRAIRKLWRLMYSEEFKAREAKRKAAKKDRKSGRDDDSQRGFDDDEE